MTTLVPQNGETKKEKEEEEEKKKKKKKTIGAHEKSDRKYAYINIPREIVVSSWAVRQVN